jgi:hypothetical protein|nr:MAG TPA: Baseplate structural protein [Caudoviricetes sp.]
MAKITYADKVSVSEDSNIPTINKIKADDMNEIKRVVNTNCDELTAILDRVYPVGRGFIDFTNTDYTNYLGFKWERELVGMTAVGIDVSQTEFDTIGKTGGSKYMQEHRHKGLSWMGADDTQSISLNGGASGKGYHLTYGSGYLAGQDDFIHTRSAGKGNAENLQPYKVVAYWKRIL